MQITKNCRIQNSIISALSKFWKLFKSTISVLKSTQNSIIFQNWNTWNFWVSALSNFWKLQNFWIVQITKNCKIQNWIISALSKFWNPSCVFRGCHDISTVDTILLQSLWNLVIMIYPWVGKNCGFFINECTNFLGSPGIFP